MRILIGGGIFIISVLSRAWVRLLRKDFGVDTWYHLNYAEGFRRKRRLPVKLSNYLLDIEEQWYPPLLPFIISLFSKKFSDRYHWLFSAVIDSLQAVILYVFALLSTGRLDVAVFAASLYISSTVNASMATNLNSRPMAGLILTVLMLALYGFTLQPGVVLFGIILLLGVILLHAHKMAAQQFLFFSVGLAIFYQNPLYIYIVFTIFVCSLFAAKGHYLKILKHHFQIIRYWSKNIRSLFKHQIYDSPFYADSGKSLARIGISGLKMHKVMFFIARAQLLLLFAIVIVIWLIGGKAQNPAGLKFFFYWVFISYFTVAVTTYLPLFKFIGEGFKYLIYGTFALSFLTAYGIITTCQNIVCAYVILLLLVLLSFYIQIFTLSRQLLNVNSFVDDELKGVIGMLKAHKKDNIMCIPVFKAEPVAYLAGKKVLWGGHGSGWELLDEFWPVLKAPLEKFIDKYKISFLLLDKRFADMADLKISHLVSVLFEGENYILAETRNII